MCGIGGAQGLNINLSDIKILGLMNQSRGRDSTGLLLQEELHKDTVDFTKMATNIKMKQDAFTRKSRSVLLHCRKKSVGLIDKDAAHPYVMSHISLVHNGTITKWDLCKTYGLSQVDFHTDSHVMAYLINEFHKNKDPDGLYNLLATYPGAAALVWKVNGKNIFYFWSGSYNDYNTLNEERPLHTGYKRNTLYFSSLAEPLKVIDCTDIKHIPKNTLQIYSKGKIISEVKIERTFEKKATVYSGPSSDSSRHAYDEYPYPGGSSYGNYARTPKKEVKLTNPQNIAENVYWFEGSYYKNGHPFTGEISDKNGKRYFYLGLMLVDEEAYNYFKGYCFNKYQIYNNLVFEDFFHEDFIYFKKGFVYKNKLAEGPLVPYGFNKVITFSTGKVIKETPYINFNYLETFETVTKKRSNNELIMEFYDKLGDILGDLNDFIADYKDNTDDLPAEANDILSLFKNTIKYLEEDVTNL